MTQPRTTRSDVGGSDVGGIVVGWLVKVTVVLAIVGVIAFDLVAIAYARVSSADDARSIAQAAHDAMLINRATPAAALVVAQERATSRGVKVGRGDITITKSGVVTVEVHRQAATLVAEKIGLLTQLTVINERYSTSDVS